MADPARGAMGQVAASYAGSPGAGVLDEPAASDHDGVLVCRGQLGGESALDSLRSWFAHLVHADTYHLRRALWSEARPILGGFIC